MNLQEQFQQIIEFRRSNRKFDPNVPVPAEVIERSLKRSILSPNSSNMQLWGFHWISSAQEKTIVAELCLGQSAAKTAQELVVFVTRPDLWKQRKNWHLAQVQ